MITFGKDNEGDYQQTTAIETCNSQKRFGTVTITEVASGKKTVRSVKKNGEKKKPFQHSPDPYAFLKTTTTNRNTTASPIVTCTSSTSQKSLYSTKPKKTVYKQTLSKKSHIQLPLEEMRKHCLVKELNAQIGSPIRVQYQTQIQSSKKYNKTIGNLEQKLNLSQDELEKVKNSNFFMDKESCIKSCLYERLLIENASISKSIIDIRKERKELYEEISRLNKETSTMNNLTNKYSYQIEEMRLKQKNLQRGVNTLREQNKLITTAWMLVLKRRDELSQGRAQLVSKVIPTIEMEISEIKKAFL